MVQKREHTHNERYETEVRASYMKRAYRLAVGTGGFEPSAFWLGVQHLIHYKAHTLIKAMSLLLTVMHTRGAM